MSLSRRQAAQQAAAERRANVPGADTVDFTHKGRAYSITSDNTGDFTEAIAAMVAADAAAGLHRDGQSWAAKQAIATLHRDDAWREAHGLAPLPPDLPPYPELLARLWGGDEPPAPAWADAVRMLAIA